MSVSFFQLFEGNLTFYYIKFVVVVEDILRLQITMLTQGNYNSETLVEPILTFKMRDILTLLEITQIKTVTLLVIY